MHTSNTSIAHVDFTFEQLCPQWNESLFYTYIFSVEILFEHVVGAKGRVKLKGGMSWSACANFSFV